MISGYIKKEEKEKVHFAARSNEPISENRAIQLQERLGYDREHSGFESFETRQEHGEYRATWRCRKTT